MQRQWFALREFSKPVSNADVASEGSPVRQTGKPEDFHRRSWPRAGDVWRFAGIAAGVVILLTVAVVAFETRESSPLLAYSEFLDQLDAGKVASVTFRGMEIEGRLKRPQDRADSGNVIQQERFRSQIPDFGDATLVSELRKQHVAIEVAPPSAWSWLLGRIPWPMLLFFGGVIVIGVFRLLRGGRTPSESDRSDMPARGMMGLVWGLFTKRRQPAASPLKGNPPPNGH